MKSLGGRIALLTGASSGIGPHIARRLRSRGAELVLSGRNKAALIELAEELGGGRVVVADLSRREQVERLAKEAGEVEILIANAGLPASGRLDSFSVEEIDRALDVNLRSAIVLANRLVPAMVGRGRGHVVLMSSMAGRVPASHMTVYDATKFGLRGFGHALRQELRGKGVGVSVICPTYVSEAGMWAETGLKANPLAGEVRPEQVADAVLAAIRRDRLEIAVAPFGARLGARLEGAFPGLVWSLGRLLGVDTFPEQAAHGQRHKR